MELILFIVCIPNPCLNGGTCTDQDGDSTAECTCTGGYTDATCSTAPAGNQS